MRAVVLDLTMPGLGGEATLQRIRRQGPRLPVIVSSGYVPDEGGTLAGVPFLAKPYRPSELVDIVRRSSNTRPSGRSPSASRSRPKLQLGEG